MSFGTLRYTGNDADQVAITSASPGYKESAMVYVPWNRQEGYDRTTESNHRTVRVSKVAAKLIGGGIGGAIAGALFGSGVGAVAAAHHLGIVALVTALLGVSNAVVGIACGGVAGAAIGGAIGVGVSFWEVRYMN